MKILVICQYYYPEPFKNNDLCEELVRLGHEVTVVTGIPNYPIGKIYPGYRGTGKRDEVLNGVKVHRCFTIGRRSGNIFRLLNYYSFAFSSSRYVSKLDDDFDIVFVYQLSPVMMANAGIKYKNKHGKKLVLYCLDLWPTSLAAGGIKSGSFIYKHFSKVSKKIYKQADKLLVSSKSFKDLLINNVGFKSKESSIEYLPQYAENAYESMDIKTEDKKTIDFVFAGNIGIAQSIPTIIKAANELKNIENIRWHIVGDGTELDYCKRLAKNYRLETVFFHGRKPTEEMVKYYSLADAMLITLIDDDILSLTLPGKVQSYMAAGKPIIAAANGEISKVITESGCGYFCKAEDYKALAATVREFVFRNKGENLGANGRDYYFKNFSRKQHIDKLVDILNSTRS